MKPSLTRTWQDAFAQEDARTLHFANLPLPGHFRAGGEVIRSVAELKHAIANLGGCLPTQARVTVDLETLEPKPPFQAFVMFATCAEAQQLADKGTIQLKGLECPVKFVQPQQPSRPGPRRAASCGPAPPSFAPPAAAGDCRGFVECDRTIRLSNLSIKQLSPEDLMASLSDAGIDVESVELLRTATGRFTGVALVNLTSVLQVAQLCADREVSLDGHTLAVSEPRGRTPVPLLPGPSPVRSTVQPLPLAPAPAHRGLVPSIIAARRPTPLRGQQRAQQPQQQRRFQEPRATAFDLERSPVHARQFVDVNRAEPGTIRFTVMTWNVLFRDFASNHAQYCLDLMLRDRRGMMFELIRRHRPDVIALQEIEVSKRCPDAGRIRDELDRELGYEVCSIAKRHTDGHGEANADDDSNMDGCLLAVRRDVFTVETNSVGRISKEHGQVGVIAHLRHVRSGRQAIVATTQLKAGTAFESERARQMKHLLKHAGRQVYREATAAAAIPVIVLGDLNTEPRWELIPGLEAGSAVGPLRDAYANRDGRPPGYTDTPFTSYSWFLQGVVDYVLHTDGLVPLKVLKVPGTRDIRELYAADYPQRRGTLGPRFELLPTKSFPSDHLPLMVEFGFEPAQPQEAAAWAAPVHHITAHEQPDPQHPRREEASDRLPHCSGCDGSPALRRRSEMDLSDYSAASGCLEGASPSNNTTPSDDDDDDGAAHSCPYASHPPCGLHRRRAHQHELGDPYGNPPPEQRNCPFQQRDSVPHRRPRGQEQQQGHRDSDGGRTRSPFAAEDFAVDCEPFSPAESRTRMPFERPARVAQPTAAANISRGWRSVVDPVAPTAGAAAPSSCILAGAL